MVKGLLAAGFCLGFALSGCGSEDTPADKCDTLITVVCDRVAECVGGAQQSCEERLKAETACGNARDVKPSYDRCIDQLNSNQCMSLFPIDPDTGQRTARLPADCEQVIVF